MPLHLLGKKSWNVYNPANIERVRRDEAEAQRHEEEQEARQRDHESDNRLRLLRGEASLLQDPGSRTDLHSSSSSYKRKRKLPGEDDTDRDIRLAKQPDVRRIDKLVDAKGNFSLIPVPESSNKKARVDEDPFTVYLSHAAGKGKNSGDKPWYSSTPGAEAGPPTRDSWGNDSPRRQEREAARVAANDPLAAMKKGVKQLREAERHRKEWMDQRERDLREVEDLARQRRRGDKNERRGRRKRDDLQKDDDLDSLDNFDLDQGAVNTSIITITDTVIIIIIIVAVLRLRTTMMPENDLKGSELGLIMIADDREPVRMSPHPAWSNTRMKHNHIPMIAQSVEQNDPLKLYRKDIHITN